MFGDGSGARTDVGRSPLRLRGRGSQNIIPRLPLVASRARGNIHALLHHLPQRAKIRLARRGAAEGEADAAAGLRIFQPQEFDPLVATLDVGGDLRNQRHAVAARDHLHHGGQAGGAERGAAGAGAAAARGGSAKRQRLIAQAVAVLEQDQAALIDVADRHPPGRTARIARGHREQKQVVEQWHRIDVGLAQRQGQQRGIERAALDLLDQLPGLGFPQLQPQLRKPGLQRGENPRQQIGRQRGNHPEH